MQQPLALMTAHGTIVCVDGADALYHVAMDAVGAGDRPLMLDLYGLTRAGRHERALAGANTRLALGHVPGLPAGCELNLDADRRTATIRSGERYFCAEPMNRAMPCDRAGAGDWETFLLLTEEDYAVLHHLRRNSWVRGATRQVVTPDAIGFAEGFVLTLGDLRLDLRRSLPPVVHTPGPGGEAASAFAYTMLADGWRLERLHLYRPLVVVTALGAPGVTGQLLNVLGALLDFGAYRGHVHVITDLDHQVILDHVPDLPPELLTVQKLPVREWKGSDPARYAILDLPMARSFQPLLCIDVDTVCDAPMQPVLAAVASLDRLCTILDDSPTMQSATGADLIRRAGGSPRFPCGLDGAVLGIPTLSAHAPLLELARTMVTNLIEQQGPGDPREVGQEALNYVSYTAGSFDTAALASFVRQAGPTDAFGPPTGLLHFAREVDGRSKADRIGAYVQARRGAALP